MKPGSITSRPTEKLVTLESDLLRVDIAPAIGGRVVSFLHKPTGDQWLWQNRASPLRQASAGANYDSEFWGGIDEQIPCDGPETIDGVDYPDHGELWTQPLEVRRDDPAIVLSGSLPLLGFDYERRMSLRPHEPVLEIGYRLTNCGSTRWRFLWKLHAALSVEAGDRICCPAATARPLDLAWSRSAEMRNFSWPLHGSLDMSLVPPPDGTAEFLALTDLASGRIGLHSAATGREFWIEFDLKTFPCCWLFASYGKLLGHYTVVLEPATSPDLTVSDSVMAATLAPGEGLVTTVLYRLVMPEGETPR